jgi:hypothetical protein
MTSLKAMVRDYFLARCAGGRTVTRKEFMKHFEDIGYGSSCQDGGTLDNYRQLLTHEGVLVKVASCRGTYALGVLP